MPTLVILTLVHVVEPISVHSLVHIHVHVAFNLYQLAIHVLHAMHLIILLARYPVVETQHVSDILAEQYAVAVCRRAEELVTELGHQTSPLDTTLLRSTQSVLKGRSYIHVHCTYMYVYVRVHVYTMYIYTCIAL